MENRAEMISDSIARSVGHPDLVEVLSSGMKPGRLQSMLLSVFERRSKDVSPSDVWRRARAQGMVQASSIDQRALVALDRLMFDSVDSGFEAVELSPLSPFGLNAALTSTNQKKIVSAVRGTEVMSNLATALAIEACARRTTVQPLGSIRLCSSHRLIRAQDYPKDFGFTPHFRVFGLATATNRDHDAGRCMRDHIRQHLTFFAAANRENYYIGQLTITLGDLSITERMLRHHGMDRSEVCARTLPTDSRLFAGDAPFPAAMGDPGELSADLQKRYGIEAQTERLSKLTASVRDLLASDFPGVTVRCALDRIGGMGHYEDLCFKIDGANAKGRSYPLVDGGGTSWMRRLLANGREQCFLSGIGTELFHRFYQASG